MQQLNYNVVVIGGGPAGLAACASSAQNGASVLLIEREAKLGGILKQCIHDGFGVIRFGQKLTGPEYAQKEIDKFSQTTAAYLTLTFVTDIEKVTGEGFCVHFVNREGCGVINTQKIILATGCRERTSKQVFIHGDNPAGVITAGAAQNYINLLGKMPCKKCVILGSGDIGLIMARRITLEGGKVIGVYEVKPTPSGLTRNIVQCLNDFGIPLYLSHTVTRVFGFDSLTAVEITQVDENMRPVSGTSQIVECDSLILSVGLIPENEIAEKLGVRISPSTKGAFVDQDFQTLTDNVYCVGNACHINDLADYVSESGEIAGRHSAKPFCERNLISVKFDKKFAYVVPQVIDVNSADQKIVCFFSSSKEFTNATVSVKDKDKVIFTKKYSHLRPPEMERITLDVSALNGESVVAFGIETDFEMQNKVKNG